MTRKGGAWRRERDADAFIREARRRGLRSRAALKLEALGARDHLFRDARVVVDLGAAPGGWSQVARRALPPDGLVVALDVLEMEELAGVEFIPRTVRIQLSPVPTRTSISHEPNDTIHLNRAERIGPCDSRHAPAHRTRSTAFGMPPAF